MRPADAVDRERSLRRTRLVIEHVVREGSIVARSTGNVHHVFPVAVSPEECEALRDRVTREGATRTIEVGLGYGLSALFICEGLLAAGNPEARHVVLDPAQATASPAAGSRS
jgi:predicted O-methyltransferase YrrM